MEYLYGALGFLIAVIYATIKKGIPNYSLSMSDIYFLRIGRKCKIYSLSVIYAIKKYPKLLSKYDERCLAYFLRIGIP
jgi:hypothetical protein